jgi:IS4 transposase
MGFGSTADREIMHTSRLLPRYRRRWKIERLIAWLQNFRRLVVRYERHAENFLAMLHLASALILLTDLLPCAGERTANIAVVR